MTPSGDLVRLKEEMSEIYYHANAHEILGVGVVLSEFTTMTGELYYEVVWATGDREYVRPSWLKLIKRNTSVSDKKSV
jgi:hypothetical protein